MVRLAPPHEQILVDPGWPAGFEPFAFGTTCSRHRRFLFRGNCRMEKEGPKPYEHVQCWARFYEQCLLPGNTTKQQIFHIVHRRTTTQKAPNPGTAASCVSNPQVCARMLRAFLVRSVEELFAIERMAAHGFGSRKITKALFECAKNEKTRRAACRHTEKRH